MRVLVLILAYLVSLLVLAAAYGGPVRIPQMPPIPTPSPVAEDAAFSRFLHDYREAALRSGIPPEVYDTATRGLIRNERISELNLNQPEFSRPVWAYIDSAVSPQRIAAGRALIAGNADILARIENKYGVAKEIVVSIWGNESDYGRTMGGYNMFEALATLAYDGPRADYARPQFLAALRMMQRQAYSPAAMTSSWAGAFGQTQFVPTSFLNEAVDGDGDGKIDLWTDVADALASTANVLSNAGWSDGKPWGYEVSLPPGFPFEIADIDLRHSIDEWRTMGLRTINGAALPESDEPASVYLPAGSKGPAFLVFPNFKVILKYNNAASYALAVCLLADQLKGAPGIVAPWPRALQPLSRDERLTLQNSLLKLGFDVGRVDGLIGTRSRAAMRAWQKAHNLPADGFATEELLTRIAMEARERPN